MTMPSPGTLPVAILEARGIERRFGGVSVWKSLDLCADNNELILLVGPNGAGKTTLLRALAGLARPPRGTIRVLGQDLYLGAAPRRSIGFLGHESMLYDDLTAQENLRFAAALHQLPLDDSAIQSALEAVGLAAQAQQRVGRFSRGMVQRLALARATLHTPTLLLLDEPFTGLDRHAAAALRHRLTGERERGCAIICVSHEPAEIWDASTRVVVLTDKQIRLDIPRPATIESFHAQYAELVA